MALAVTLATGGMLALGATAATAASAAPAWEHHHHHHQLRPEQFDILINSAGGGQNQVDAEGPVAIHQGTDTTISNVIDHFNQDNADYVRVWHAPLPTPVVDLRTCSVLFTLTDAPWRFVGGVGQFDGATGFGVFDLQAMFSFNLNRDGRCSLAGLGDDQISNMINSPSSSSDTSAAAMGDSSVVSFCHRHHIPVPVLLADDISVQGTGFASLRQHEPKPEVTPTETVTTASG